MVSGTIVAQWHFGYFSHHTLFKRKYLTILFYTPRLYNFFSVKWKLVNKIVRYIIPIYFCLNLSWLIVSVSVTKMSLPMHNAQCALHMSLNVFMRLTLTAYVSASAMASATAPAITNATCCICNNIVYTTTPTMHASVSATANVKFNVSFIATYCLTPEPCPTLFLFFLLYTTYCLTPWFTWSCSCFSWLSSSSSGWAGRLGGIFSSQRTVWPLIHLVLFLFLLAIFFIFWMSW